jgi:hypothetical protein
MVYWNLLSILVCLLPLIELFYPKGNEKHAPGGDPPH